MKYIVYLTKNKLEKVNGINRIYIGVHATENPTIFDGYIGCGVYIKQPSTYINPKTPFQCAVKKYGINAFERQILFIYDNIEDAYKKEAELVDLNFLKLEYTYNACLGGSYYNNYKKLYQFSLDGELIKVWEYSKDAYDFYGYPIERFKYAVNDKHPFLNFLWSTKPKIDYTEYITNKPGSPKITYLYSKGGKFLGEFYSEKECANYLGVNPPAVSKGILNQNLMQGKYYVSNTLVDLFIPKPRRQYFKTKFYIYKDNTLIFVGIGKEIMPIISLNSWAKISDIFRYNKGWYKDFYISLEEIEKVPEKGRKNSIKIDIYDKYGNFIETLNTLKQVKEKYKVPASKIKNIQCGDRYYKDWIFKYHSK